MVIKSIVQDLRRLDLANNSLGFHVQRAEIKDFLLTFSDQREIRGEITGEIDSEIVEVVRVDLPTKNPFLSQLTWNPLIFKHNYNILFKFV